MSPLEIFAIVISTIAIIGTTTTWIVSFKNSIEDDRKKIVTDYLDYMAMMKSAQYSSKKEFNNKELETVANIVRKYSGEKLIKVLKNPEDRFIIYQGLTDPSQQHWDKAKFR